MKPSSCLRAIRGECGQSGGTARKKGENVKGRHERSYNKNNNIFKEPVVLFLGFHELHLRAKAKLSIASWGTTIEPFAVNINGKGLRQYNRENR